MKYTFIGIGAQKCASTWLHQALRSHPQIGIDESKEPDFFSYTYGRGFEWYESANEGFAECKAIGEVSPSYFHHPEAPARAFRYDPNLRIIVSLRDPIERAYSNHLHLVRLGLIKGKDHTFEHGISNCPMYLHQSHYAVHVERWLSIFPRTSFLFVLQEDVAADPAGEMARLFNFLDVDPSAGRIPEKGRSNLSTVPKHAGLHRGLRSLGALAKNAGLKPLVESVKSAGFVRRLLERNAVDLRKIVPPLRQDTIETLQTEFKDDVAYVRRLLERDDLRWKHFQ